LYKVGSGEKQVEMGVCRHIGRMTLFRQGTASTIDSQLLHFGLEGGAFHPQDFGGPAFFP
jgi:hypothetical protein